VDMVADTADREMVVREHMVAVDMVMRMVAQEREDMVDQEQEDMVEVDMAGRVYKVVVVDMVEKVVEIQKPGVAEEGRSGRE